VAAKRRSRAANVIALAARKARLVAQLEPPAPSDRDLPDYLPARMLNEFVYCPRLFFYEWVEGVFARNSDTIEGELRHEKLEIRSDPLPPPGDVAEIHSRSVTLSSQTHRLIAKIDLIEGANGSVTPVDYKKGHPKDSGDGPDAWPADRAQLGAQALILRDNGYRCNEAIAYYHATRQRVRIAIDEALIDEVLRAAAAATVLARRGVIPPPLVDSPKCPRCSLVGICLPDETLRYETLPLAAPNPQLSLFDESDASLRAPHENENLYGGWCRRAMICARSM
jgi:CRISPR-associated protein Cas1